MNQDKQKFFFEQYGLNEADLERYLGAALGAGGDYADLYFEYLTTTSITLDESMVKSASQGISAGCGVRVISGERTGYAYTDDLAPEKILRAARTAALIASGPAKQPVVNLKEHGQQNLYPVNTFSVDADISAKLALVQRADDKPETVRNRLVVYHKNTQELVPYYRAQGLLREADGTGAIEEVYANIMKALNPQAGKPC